MNYVFYYAKLQSFLKYFLPSACVILYLPRRLSLICGFTPVLLFPWVALLCFSFPPTFCIHSPFVSMKNYSTSPTVHLPLLNSYCIYIYSIQFIVFSLLLSLIYQSLFPKTLITYRQEKWLYYFFIYTSLPSPALIQWRLYSRYVKMH